MCGEDRERHRVRSFDAALHLNEEQVAFGIELKSNLRDASGVNIISTVDFAPVFSVVGFSALLARIYCWNKKVSKPPAISKSQIDDRAPVTISQVETQLDATVAAADV